MTSTLDRKFEKFAIDLEKRLLTKVAELIAGSKLAKPEVIPTIPTDRTRLPKMPKGVTVYEKPQEGRVYFIGADIGEGLGGCEDSALSVVYCTDEGPNLKVHQVAWYSKNTVDPYKFADILNDVGRIYNDAVLAPEVNRYDSTLWALRKKHGYPNLYRWKTVDSVNATSSKLGWFTNTNSKPRLEYLFRTLLKHRRVEINDPVCKKDIEDWFSNRVPEFTGTGIKDDHIRALMIAAYVATEG